MSSKYTIQNDQGLYFLTFTVVQWVDVFTRQSYRDILIDSFRYCQEQKGLNLYAYVIMSNHLHCIASADKGAKLSGIVRDMKKHASKKITDAIQSEEESRKGWLDWIFSSAGRFNKNNENYQVWQQHNHATELWSFEMIKEKADYIHYNPVKAGLVELPEHWKYSSASNYAGLPELLDVILLF
jgi:putative transposase